MTKIDVSAVDNLFTSFNKSHYNKQLNKFEYKGDNDIVFCKKCNTPKEELLKFDEMDEVVFFPIDCDCVAKEKKEIADKEKQTLLQEINNIKVEQYKKDCFNIELFKEWTFENDDNKNLSKLDRFVKYCDGFENIKKMGGVKMVVYGDYDTGKSYYAASIANRLCEMQYRCKMFTFDDIVNLGSQWEKGQTILDSYMDYDCLILDDLGTERYTEFSSEKIFNFIDKVNNNQIPMIITTNLLYSEIKEISKQKGSQGRIYQRIANKSFSIQLLGIHRRADTINEVADKMRDFFN